MECSRRRISLLSKGIGGLYDWPGTVFPRRYTAVEVSDEVEIQAQRLKTVAGKGLCFRLPSGPE